MSGEHAVDVPEDPGRCLACGARTLGRPELMTRAPDDGRPFRLARCGACGTLETFPRPSDGDLAHYYAPVYYQRSRRPLIAMAEAFWRFCRSRQIRRIEKHVPDGGSILDVSCGTGLFLSVVSPDRWARFGTEAYEEPARAARELGIDARVGEFVHMDFPVERFDVVTMWHVLEHIPDVPAALDRVRDILKPGGLLAVGVPNIDSVQAKIGGSMWFGLDAPRHLHHFSAASLSRILGQHGFDVLETRHFSLEYNVPICVQTLYNRTGLPLNYVYGRRAHVADPSTDVRAGTKMGRRLLAVALAPPVMLVSGAIVALETLVRRGGTIEMYARRR